MYSKFNAEGYPTNQAGRAQCLKLLNIARWPAEVSTNIRLPNRRLLPAVSNALSHDAPADRSPSSIKLTHNNGIIRTQLNEANNTIDTDSFLWTDPPPIPDDLQVGSSSIFLSVDESFENPLPSNPPSVGAYQGQHDGQWEFVGLDPQENFDIQSLAPGAYSTSSQIPEAISQMETHNDILSVHSDILSQRNVTPLLYDESPRSISLADKCKFQPLADSPSPCSQLVLPPSPRYSGSARGSKVDGRNSSWRPKPKYNRSCTPEKRSSTSTSDSGYASGRSSPFPPVPEANNLHPQSLSEFGGLHRIPCQNLHEPSPYNEIYTPQSQTRFKDTLTCSQCLYSSIHNLSWSARYLNLEVFKKKLTNTKMEFERQGIYNLDVLYDVTALDATGNSALHYAAAGGAGFEHFTSLIQIGVSPYQLNTAGQLFLHCWQPHLQKSKQNAISGDFIALFNADLVNLLNHFQPTGAFRWRDNEGKTVLDSLACVLTHEIKEQTFR